MFEQAPGIAVEERGLTEADLLNRHRLPDGSHHPDVLRDQLLNLITATQELAMPHAVSRTEYNYAVYGYDAEGDDIIASPLWLDRPAEQTVHSGYSFHKHPAALARVDIEVEEASDIQNIRPGTAKIMISPRMTRSDAPLNVARAEHLADDDAVRIGYWKTDAGGRTESWVVESLLVRQVPLEAWAALLRDPNNLFSKAIEVADTGSALPIMAAHRELNLPLSALPEGPVTLLLAVLPYVTDRSIQMHLQRQIQLFRGDQRAMYVLAVDRAVDWQSFEINLADSLASGQATFAIEAFINCLQQQWSAEDRAVILAHGRGGHYAMTRQLAVIVERAKKNFIMTEAGLRSGNEYITSQIDAETKDRIAANCDLINLLSGNGYTVEEINRLRAETNRLIAQNNVQGGGGCSGDSNPGFNNGGGPDDTENAENTSEDRESWTLSRGKCVVDSCPTRPGVVKVGPCGVCMDRCQKLYDAGIDPTKRPALAPVTAKKTGQLVLQKV